MSGDDLRSGSGLRSAPVVPDLKGEELAYGPRWCWL